MTSSNGDPATAFGEASAIAAYADRTRRLVPGWADLQTMATLLLSERTPPEARVLVVGAGGGVELRAFAQAQPGWRFLGVDPSAPMLSLAKETLGALAGRVDFHEGLVDTAAAGPFDAASCLLTMHFVPLPERGPTLSQIHRRLRPGAPFVMAHMSFAQAPSERERWLSRYAAFAIASGVEPAAARRAASTIGATLPVLAPADEEALLAGAGFKEASLFYAGLAFRGWVMHA